MAYIKRCISFLILNFATSLSFGPIYNRKPVIQDIQIWIDVVNLHIENPAKDSDQIKPHQIYLRNDNETPSTGYQLYGISQPGEIYISIRNLTPFTNYSSYVVAVLSENVYSEPSNVVQFRTFSTYPSEPLNPKISLLNEREVVITWDPPARQNGILSHYEVLIDINRQTRRSNVTTDDKYIFQLPEEAIFINMAVAAWNLRIPGEPYYRRRGKYSDFVTVPLPGKRKSTNSMTEIKTTINNQELGISATTAENIITTTTISTVASDGIGSGTPMNPDVKSNTEEASTATSGVLLDGKKRRPSSKNAQEEHQRIGEKGDNIEEWDEDKNWVEGNDVAENAIDSLDQGQSTPNNEFSNSSDPKSTPGSVSGMTVKTPAAATLKKEVSNVNSADLIHAMSYWSSGIDTQGGQKLWEEERVEKEREKDMEEMDSDGRNSVSSSDFTPDSGSEHVPLPATGLDTHTATNQSAAAAAAAAAAAEDPSQTTVVDERKTVTSEEKEQERLLRQGGAQEGETEDDAHGVHDDDDDADDDDDNIDNDDDDGGGGGDGGDEEGTGDDRDSDVGGGGDEARAPVDGNSNTTAGEGTGADVRPGPGRGPVSGSDPDSDSDTVSVSDSDSFSASDSDSGSGLGSGSAAGSGSISPAAPSRTLPPSSPAPESGSQHVPLSATGLDTHTATNQSAAAAAAAVAAAAAAAEDPSQETPSAETQTTVVDEGRKVISVEEVQVLEPRHGERQGYKEQSYYDGLEEEADNNDNEVQELKKDEHQSREKHGEKRKDEEEEDADKFGEGDAGRGRGAQAENDNAYNPRGEGTSANDNTICTDAGIGPCPFASTATLNFSSVTNKVTSKNLSRFGLIGRSRMFSPEGAEEGSQREENGDEGAVEVNDDGLNAIDFSDEGTARSTIATSTTTASISQSSSATESTLDSTFIESSIPTLTDLFGGDRRKSLNMGTQERGQQTLKGNEKEEGEEDKDENWVEEDGDDDVENTADPSIIFPANVKIPTGSDAGSHSASVSGRISSASATTTSSTASSRRANDGGFRRSSSEGDELADSLLRSTGSGSRTSNKKKAISLLGIIATIIVTLLAIIIILTSCCILLLRRRRRSGRKDQKRIYYCSKA